MAICIYPQDARDFSNNGLGILTPLECTVEERAAGLCELEMVHPIDEALRWAQIKNGCILRAPAPVRESPLYEYETGGEAQTVIRKIYKANTERMYLREEPKVNTVKLCALPHHTEVVLLEYDGGKWAKVAKVKGGDAGWCPYGGLTFVREQEEKVEDGQVVGGRVIELEQSRNQLFRIYSVEEDTEAATVTARAMHVFYDLRGNLIDGDLEFEEKPAAEAAGEAFAKLLNETDVTLHAEHAEGSISGEFGWKSPVEALLDPDEGMVRQTGGLLLRDNFDVYLLPDKVRDTGVTIRRGKNLIGVTATSDDADAVTRIIPVGKDKDGKDLYLDGQKYVDSPRINDYPAVRARRIEYDVKAGSDEFKDNKAVRAELLRLAQAEYSENGIDLPSYGMEIDFVLLGNTEEYAQYAHLQAVHLYDTVTVIDEMIGLKAKLRVTGYKWDCLAKQYESVTLGELQELEQTIYSYNLPDGGISGTKIAPNSMDGSAIRSASIDYAKINNAAIQQLSAQAITALTARIEEIVAKKLTTDELYAAFAEIIALKVGTITAENIRVDELAAELARITVLAAGTATFDRATVEHLVAEAMNLEFGVAGQVFIRNLAVDYAQLVSAAIGNLCIRASDGSYWRIDVSSDGSVSATPAQPDGGEIAAGQTSDGRVILETDITARNLNTTNLLATYALVNRIDAARIDVDQLFAREAFVDLLRTSRIIGGQSLEMIVGRVEDGEKKSRVFRQDKWPSGDDGVKPNDLLVLPSTGEEYQAVEDLEIELQFAMSDDGNLYYATSNPEIYKAEMRGVDAYVSGFMVSVDRYGVLGVPYNWVLVRAMDVQNAMDAANAAVSMPDFERIIRFSEETGLYIGDNRSNSEVRITSASVDIMFNKEPVSTFAGNFIRLDNMQVVKVQGGLAISVFKKSGGGQA